MINLILQIVAVVATGTSWIPQAWRSGHSSDVQGISVSSWGLGAATGLVFCLYGMRSEVWSLALSEGVFGLGALGVIATVLGWRKVGLVCVGSLFASVVIVLSCSATTIAVVGIVGSLGMRLLQIHRTWKSQSTAGMSSGAWLLLCLNVGAWGAFGWRTNRWPLVATSGLVLVSAVVLLGVVWVVRGREERLVSSRG